MNEAVIEKRSSIFHLRFNAVQGFPFQTDSQFEMENAKPKTLDE